MIPKTGNGRLGRLVTVVAVALALAIPAGAGLAHMAKGEGFRVIHPWTEPAAAGQATKAYPTLVSTSDGELALTGVSSEVAERVEIVVDGETVDRLAVPAGTTLGADRFHLRLVGLNRDLVDGGHYTATLRFADGRTEEITMVVGEDTMTPEEQM